MSTKRFPYVVRSFFVFALVLLSASPPVFAMPLGQSSGDMDIDGYCRYLGYNGSRLDPTQQNVFGWGCLKSDGTQAGMDLYDLCRWQYGGELPYPEYSEYANPYSWFCSADDLESPVSRSQPDPVQPQAQSQDVSVSGDCPGFNRSELIYGLFESDGKMWLHESPSLSSKKIYEVIDSVSEFIPLNVSTCVDGYTWDQLNVRDTSIVGWLATYNKHEQITSTKTPAIPKPQSTLIPDFSQDKQSDGSSTQSNSVSSTCYFGQRFGTEKDKKGIHHYVEFDVDSDITTLNWSVSGPFWPKLFAAPVNGKLKAGFRWLDFLPVLLKPSWFKACAVQ